MEQTKIYSDARDETALSGVLAIVQAQKCISSSSWRTMLKYFQSENTGLLIQKKHFFNKKQTDVTRPLTTVMLDNGIT